jgi:hypothetical protein
MDGLLARLRRCDAEADIVVSYELQANYYLCKPVELGSV